MPKAKKTNAPSRSVAKKQTSSKKTASKSVKLSRRVFRTTSKIVSEPKVSPKPQKSKQDAEIVLWLRDMKTFALALARIHRNILAVFVLAFAILLFIPQTDLLASPLATTVLYHPLSNPPVSLQPALYPQKNKDALPPPAISAKSAIVIDVESQVVLFALNEHEQFKPASTTKIMTALVGLDTFNPDDILTVSDKTIEGSKMGLVPLERITFENLMYGMLLNSGNDASYTVAANDPQGYQHFIDKMNAKAQELHLDHTHFQNSSGLEAENHYTTALDLARLATFALPNKLFAKVVATDKKTVTDVSGTHIHQLRNLNQLLGTFEGAIGVKTGFTEEAGQVLVAAATRNNHTLVSVVLKSDDRFEDSRRLLDWTFANHTYVPLSTKDTVIAPGIRQ